MSEVLLNYFNYAYSAITDFSKNSIFYFPLLLSLLSALIFWLIFSFLPSKKRYKKLRPILEFDLYKLSNSLLHIFDLVFKHHDISIVSLYQSEIKSGHLNEQDFQIALQNKCLNEHYLYPEDIAKSYIVVGERLLKDYTRIDEIINKIFFWEKYVSEEELLLLEKIRTNIRTYQITEESINKSPIITIKFIGAYNDQNSNISHMYKQLFELYKLYQGVLKKSLKFKFENRNTVINKVQLLFYKESYTDCLLYIKKVRKKRYENCINLLDSYELKCRYYLNKINLKKIRNILNKKPYNGALVSSRDTYAILTKNKDVKQIYEELYSKQEIEDAEKEIEKEEKLKELFIKSNIYIKEYFEQQKID